MADTNQKSGLAIAALVLGIISVAFAALTFIGIICGILAIIFGALSLHSKSRGKAIAGVITGSVGVLLSLILVLIVFIALPSLQGSQRDSSRKSDISTISSEVTTFTANNRGVLPTAADLTTSDLSTVTTITDMGDPSDTRAVYKAGQDCDGVAADRAYSVSIELESGEIYCQNS